jgi:hypothetical protein
MDVPEVSQLKAKNTNLKVYHYKTNKKNLFIVTTGLRFNCVSINCLITLRFFSV